MRIRDVRTTADTHHPLSSVWKAWFMTKQEWMTGGAVDRRTCSCMYIQYQPKKKKLLMLYAEGKQNLQFVTFLKLFWFHLNTIITTTGIPFDLKEKLLVVIPVLVTKMSVCHWKKHLIHIKVMHREVLCSTLELLRQKIIPFVLFLCYNQDIWIQMHF